MTTAPVLRAAHVRREPADAFRLFTDHIGAWWPLPTHGLFGERSGGVGFEGGRLVERSVTGETVVWAEVVEWDEPHRLVLAWHPGRPVDGPASRVEVTFAPAADGTRVEIVHRGWEAFGEGAAAARHGYSGPSAWGAVLDHFADVADRDHHAVDLDALAEAYESFFAEAERGGFASPTDGGWTAEQVVAHVAVNDDAMAAVTRSLVLGRSPSFANDPSNDAGVLDAHLAAAGGDLAGLVRVGRARAASLRLLLGRLGDDELRAEVPCHLVDGATVVLDAPVPWGRLAVATQASFHLHLHTEQLRSLRH